MDLVPAKYEWGLSGYAVQFVYMIQKATLRGG